MLKFPARISGPTTGVAPGKPHLGKTKRTRRLTAVWTGIFATSVLVMGFPLPASAATTAVMVKDIHPTRGSLCCPAELVDADGTLFFRADDGASGYELWKSDGTTDGTTLVKDINPGSASSYPGSLANLNGTLFFSADDGTGGRELWKSDGTEGGTVPVTDVPGTAGLAPAFLTNLNGTLFFRGFDPSTGEELWKTDGTAAGTMLVKDINPNYYAWASPPQAGSSDTRHLTVVNGTLYFSANDGATGSELWKSDGTAEGTVLVKDINPGWNSSSPWHLADAGGTLFFSAWDPSAGRNKLWKSDGTTAGTVVVADVLMGYPAGLNGTLYFMANDGATGWELWKSDGTAAGTVLFKDIYPGPNNSFPSDLTNINGTLFFKASNGITGYEVWSSDGTVAGTALYKDVKPGPGDSYAEGFTRIGDTLFFGAEGSLTTGFELWKIFATNTPPSATAGADVSGAEGSQISLDATVGDSDGDTVTSGWTYTAGTGVDAGATCSFTDAAAVDTDITCTDDGTYTATLTANDSVNADVTDTVTVTVTNAAPVATITAPSADSLHALGTAVNVSASFTDAGDNDTHTCSIDWGDGTTPDSGSVNETSGDGSCDGNHTYAAAGLYTISATISDGDTGSDTETVGIVVYDPSGGFVTGAGSFDSPSGAYTPNDPTDPDVTGRARFRFVSKYQKGATAPTGNTGFDFQAAGLSFESESYAWLVVSGPKAQFKGSGAVNGATGYDFLLTANDGQVTGGGGVDRFRIKIWDKTTGVVVYDNQPADGDDANAATAISGGQIMVQKK